MRDLSIVVRCDGSTLVYILSQYTTIMQEKSFTQVFCMPEASPLLRKFRSTETDLVFWWDNIMRIATAMELSSSTSRLRYCDVCHLLHLISFLPSSAAGESKMPHGHVFLVLASYTTPHSYSLVTCFLVYCFFYLLGSPQSLEDVDHHRSKTTWHSLNSQW